MDTTVKFDSLLKMSSPMTFDCEAAGSESRAGAGSGSGSGSATSERDQAYFLYQQAEKLKTTAGHTMQLAIKAKEISLSCYAAHLIYVQEIRNELVDAVSALAIKIDAYARENSTLVAAILTERKHDVIREVSYLCTVIDSNEGEPISKLQSATTWCWPTISKVDTPSSIERNLLAKELSSRIPNLRMVWGLTNGDVDTHKQEKINLFSIRKQILEMPLEKKREQLLKKYETVQTYWLIYAPTFRDALDSVLEKRATLNFLNKTEKPVSDLSEFHLKIEESEIVYNVLEHYKNQVLEITKEFLSFKLGEIPGVSSSAAEESKEEPMPEIQTAYNHLCYIYVRMQTHTTTFKERLDRLKQSVATSLS